MLSVVALLGVGHVHTLGHYHMLWPIPFVFLPLRRFQLAQTDYNNGISLKDEKSIQYLWIN